MAKTVAITFGIADVPTDKLADEGELRLYVRRAIALACDNRLEPDLLAPNPAQRRSLMTHLTDAQASYLLGLMAKQGAKPPLAAAVGRLAEAGMRFLAGAAPNDQNAQANALQEVLKALNFSDRPEQRAIYTYATQALAAHEATALVAAQASTGIGKTTVMHALTLDWLRGRNGATSESVVTLAFPSLHGVKTFAAQWESARQAGLATPPIVCLFGRSEYASQTALEHLLDEPSTNAPNLKDADLRVISNWVAQQIEQSTATQPAGSNAGDGRAPWLLDDLATLVDGLDRSSLCINGLTPPHDLGRMAYLGQFERAAKATVIACSHHMLAFDVMLRSRAHGRDDDFRERRQEVREEYFSAESSEARSCVRAEGGRNASVDEKVAELAIAYERELLSEGTPLETRRLPPYQHLIVDEAHLLEQAFSSCFSSSVSLREVAKKLDALARLDTRKSAHGALLEAAAATHAACKELSALGRDNHVAEIDTRLGLETGVERALRTIAWALKGAKPSKRSPQEALPLLASIERDRVVVEMCLENATRAVRLMDFSPARHYPHLVIGSGNVRGPLHILWAGVRTAVLLSATLYVRRSDGWSSRYQAELQSIPGHRLREIPVVESPWLYAPVQALYLPPPVATPRADRLHRPWLMPPSRQDRLGEAEMETARTEWHSEVADTICWAYNTGAGGMLVPCTSHETVMTLAKLLREHDNLGGASILASTDFGSLGALRSAALECARQGQRPLMLATGGAWTGFDMSGKAIGLDPSDDNLLCDLVIPRLPFSLNRSITHRQRVADKRSKVNHEIMSVMLLMQQALGRLVRSPGLPRNRRILILDSRLVDTALRGWLSAVLRVIEPYAIEQLDRGMIEAPALKAAKATS